MIGAALGLISSLIGAATSSSANRRTQSDVDRIIGMQRVPEGVRRGEAILRESAAGDMPGYENAKSEIDASIPTTLNQAKDYVSGGGLISALTNMYTKANAEKRALNDRNADWKTSANNRLATYLGSIVGGSEQTMQNNINDLALAKVGVSQAGTQDKLNYMNMGLNSVANDTSLYAVINQLLGLGEKKQRIPTGGELAPKTPAEATFDY